MPRAGSAPWHFPWERAAAGTVFYVCSGDFRVSGS